MVVGSAFVADEVNLSTNYQEVATDIKMGIKPVIPSFDEQLTLLVYAESNEADD